MPTVLGAWGLSHLTTREVTISHFMFVSFCLTVLTALVLRTHILEVLDFPGTLSCFH